MDRPGLGKKKENKRKKDVRCITKMDEMETRSIDGTPDSFTIPQVLSNPSSILSYFSSLHT